ncbi:hypothetical protein FA09DRAFT_338417 [Tilletiopsis washingtonensis]|uniref:Uncharacterized protein n=1 Tax=Tilletiopsis washingtonensis TaxID=58919 RepID=A0A316ZC05_9BASI|nr:hypothetical protein FA09DRAFT_338417 [Tilletiopsis washingtonensis]PWN98564.1 hypothetical protein FA09DRAFT_338417 [Tilletiopsis washingtonensis]
MRASSSLLLAALVVVAGSASAQNSDTAPFGPLTTNNGQSACVQFGDCTAGGNPATTQTFASAITSPASSQAVAAPTNALQSSNAISLLAASGASAAFASRSLEDVSVNRGSTSKYTGTIQVAGQAPSSVAPTGTSRPDAAAASLGDVSHVWSTALAVAAAAAAGAVFVL